MSSTGQWQLKTLQQAIPIFLEFAQLIRVLFVCALFFGIRISPGGLMLKLSPAKPLFSALMLPLQGDPSPSITTDPRRTAKAVEHQNI